MKSLRGVVIAVLVLSVVIPATAQQPPFGRRVLEDRTVWIYIKDYGRNVEATCLGFRVWNQNLPRSVELVMTAAHCVRELTSNASIKVTSTAGISGSGRAWYWSTNFDVGFLLVKAPVGLGGMFPMRDYYTAPPANTEVVALISIGGGAPTPASGLVERMEGPFVVMLLPGGHGSSGGAVVGLNSGRLVGLISGPGTGTAYTPDSASYELNAIGAAVIFQFLNQHINEMISKAREIAVQP